MTSLRQSSQQISVGGSGTSDTTLRMRDCPGKADAWENLICAVLRGEAPAWPNCQSAAQESALLKRCTYHGVLALLNERLQGAGSWPVNIRETIRCHAIGQAMWELRHQQLLTELHAALAAKGIQPVVLKGTALAYALYPNPVLRGRGDTDLIIPLSAREQVHEVLEVLGFERCLGVSGEFVSYQSCYTLSTAEAGQHSIDLHWRINNSELLSRLFAYDELRENAMSLSGLCRGALGLNPVYALLLACMHRDTHKQNPYYAAGAAHYSADRLIWIYDIDLLARSLPPAQWHDLVRLAGNKGLCATCLDGIERARQCFHTPYPDFVSADLAGSGAKARPDVYLNAGKLRQQWMDFQALEGIASKLRFLRELVVPPSDYILAKYPSVQPGDLPWVYARRAFGGFIKALKANSQL